MFKYTVSCYNYDEVLGKVNIINFILKFPNLEKEIFVIDKVKSVISRDHYNIIEIEQL